MVFRMFAWVECIQTACWQYTGRPSETLKPYFNPCCLHRQFGFVNADFAEVENTRCQHRIGFAFFHAIN